MRFTIFSGCYNSSGTIERLFTSIKSQTYRDFEWIVFDDCSLDNTSELIEGFIKDNSNIPITFIRHKTNKGIKFSYLETLKIARGQYLIQWDHDDIQKPHQLEVFDKILKHHRNEELAGIWALCEDQNGVIQGNMFPDHNSIGNYFTHFRKYITRYGSRFYQNERMPCINIEKLKQLQIYINECFPDDTEILFPTFRWAFLSVQGNKIIFINEVVRTYFINQGNHTLSKQSGIAVSEGITIKNRYWINLFFKFLDYRSWYFKLRLCGSYVYHGITSGHSFKKLLSFIDPIKEKIVITLIYLPILGYYKVSYLLNKQFMEIAGNSIKKASRL